MNTRGLIAILVALLALGLLPRSPLVVSGDDRTCGGPQGTQSATWSPVTDVVVSILIQACGFHAQPGFTSELHEVKASTNSGSIQARSSDFYIEGLQYPCSTFTNCHTIYFNDTDTGLGVFPDFKKTLQFSNVGCVTTNLNNFTVTYTPTNTIHVFTLPPATEIAPTAACTA